MRKVVLFFLMLLPTQLLAAPGSITTVNIKSNPTSAQVIFVLDQKTRGDAKYSPHDNQLTVDFIHTQKKFNFKENDFKNSILKSMNVTELADKKLRFHFQFTHHIKWSIELLPALKNHKYWVKLTANEKKDFFSSDELKASFLKMIKKITHKANQEVLIQDQQINARLQKNKSYKSSSHSAAKKKMFVIVIDPGHGGRDLGARGLSGCLEKDIVLSIAKILAYQINQSANMRAVLTRSGDYFVPLRKRMELARKGKADLFIAIHADAYFHKQAKGASVYALSSRGATSEAARWLAKRENYADLGGVELNALQDKSILLRSVLVDLAQTASIKDSLQLGSHLLIALEKITALHHRSVEQAPFMVLKSPDIPSILVETGFITNPFEESRLAHRSYQVQLAFAIKRGIQTFLKEDD